MTLGRDNLFRVAGFVEGVIGRKMLEACAEKAVIGLSGGVDSALVAALCVGALGRERVSCYHLPVGKDVTAERDARLVADHLGLGLGTVDLQGPFDAFLNALPESWTIDKVGLGNIKSRLRMVTLMHMARQYNGLVMGTGNMSELMVGYFTKFGDGGVDMEPIGRLFKTEVWELAKFMGLPERIVKKKPTAGLWKGQTDEGQLGITYKQLDRVLGQLEPYWPLPGDANGRNPGIWEGRHDGTMSRSARVRVSEFARIRELVRKNAHKSLLPGSPAVRGELTSDSIL